MHKHRHRFTHKHIHKHKRKHNNACSHAETIKSCMKSCRNTLVIYCVTFIVVGHLHLTVVIYGNCVEKYADSMFK